MNTMQPDGGFYALRLGVKAGMVRGFVCGWQIKLWIPCYTWAISERFRDRGLYIKRCIYSSVYVVGQ